MEASEAYENGLKHDPNNAQLKEAAKNIDAKMGMCPSLKLGLFLHSCGLSLALLLINLT